MYTYFKSMRERQEARKQGKFLAQAIKNANNPDMSDRDYWTSQAEELASDTKVLTDYVPIRDIITSLQQGNFTLANKLYGKPQSTKELHQRADKLVSQLLRSSANNSIKIAQVEEADHWLSILSSIRIANLARIQVGVDEMKNYLREEVQKNLMLKNKNPEEIERMIEFIASTPFDSRENVQKVLPFFKQIVPVFHRGARLEDIKGSAKGMAILIREINKEFPIDVVPDNKDHISISGTMGLEKDSFKDFMGVGKEPDNRPDYDHFEANALLLGKPVEEAKYGPAFDIIEDYCKKNGYSYLLTVQELLERGYKVPQEHIRRIYYEGREVFQEEYKRNLESSLSPIAEEEVEHNSEEVTQTILEDSTQENHLESIVEGKSSEELNGYTSEAVSQNPEYTTPVIGKSSEMQILYHTLHENTTYHNTGHNNRGPIPRPHSKRGPHGY